MSSKDFELDTETDLSYKLIRESSVNGSAYRQLTYLVNDLGEHGCEKGVYLVTYHHEKVRCKECDREFCRHSIRIYQLLLSDYNHH